MRFCRVILLVVIAALIASGCRKPYSVTLPEANSGYLVVEGVINTGPDSTLIKLSRTTLLADTTRFKPETKATLYVEDDKNGRYNLKEFSAGVYKCAAFNTTNIQKCRLHIVTSSKTEYVSDYTEVLNTPVIDSLNFTYLSDGLQFSVNTHDATNRIKYFRWSFDETWEYTSFLLTELKYAGNGVVVARPANENIHFCWLNAASNQILLASTDGLTQSVVNQQPLATVPISSGKFQVGYSMLLKQYAMDKEGFAYWQKLKKNTEQLGSIFDAQPSEIVGNIHNLSNAAEPVIGYINACVIRSKRILIDRFSLKISSPGYFPKPDPIACGLDSVYIQPSVSFPFRLASKVGRGDSTIVRELRNPITNELIGYSYAGADCVDCRIKDSHGKNIRPSYWPPNL